jgi:hypothetical protein
MKKEFWHYMENDKIKNKLTEIEDIDIIKNKPTEIEDIQKKYGITDKELWRTCNHYGGVEELANKIEKNNLNPTTGEEAWELAQTLESYYRLKVTPEEKKKLWEKYSPHNQYNHL